MISSVTRIIKGDMKYMKVQGLVLLADSKVDADDDYEEDQ